MGILIHMVFSTYGMIAKGYISKSRITQSKGYVFFYFLDIAKYLSTEVVPIHTQECITLTVFPCPSNFILFLSVF